jgi:hypothetical protein
MLIGHAHVFHNLSNNQKLNHKEMPSRRRLGKACTPPSPVLAGLAAVAPAAEGDWGRVAVDAKENLKPASRIG